MTSPSTDEPYTVPAPGDAAAPVRTPEELEQRAARRKAADMKQARKENARARWTLLNRFIDDGMAGLELSDAAVWFVLFRHARADGAAMVARGRLVAITGCDGKTITAALQRLGGAGWVARLRRGGPSGGVAVYRVQYPGKVGE